MDSQNINRTNSTTGKCIMNVNPINNNQTFEGKLVQKGAIAKEQRALYLKKKPTIEGMIKELPFDLTVTQNNKSKIISMTTNVEGAKSFVVKKGKHFVEAASAAIEDGKSKSKLYKTSINVAQMFEYKKAIFISILSGKMKAAKEFQMELAKIAVKNYEDYKLIPQINMVNVPIAGVAIALVRNMQYRIYRMFTGFSSEEKLLIEKQKEYLKELKSKNIKQNQR